MDIQPTTRTPARNGEEGKHSPLALAPALQVEGLCRRYGRTWALAGVDFQVARGEVLLLAGSNGSGKSTLLRVLAGALRPDAGIVRIEGHAGRDEQRRRTALVGHAFNTYEALSALQNLTVYARLLDLPATRDDLMPLLEKVGLGARADDDVHTFSAGMHKRLALARLLLQRPAVALLDEPYGQLDPAGFALLDSIISDLRAKGASVIVASHLLEHGAARCDRALLLGAGQVLWTGPAEDLPAVSRAANLAPPAAAEVV